MHVFLTLTLTLPPVDQCDHGEFFDRRAMRSVFGDQTKIRIFSSAIGKVRGKRGGNLQSLHGYYPRLLRLAPTSIRISVEHQHSSALAYPRYSYDANCDH